MKEKRDKKARQRINKNIDRHVDVIKLRLSDKEIDDITVNYWTERIKGRVKCSKTPSD